MSNGQWTVTGLILFLLGLEVLRSANVRNFFKSIYSGAKTSLNSATKQGG